MSTSVFFCFVWFDYWYIHYLSRENYISFNIMEKYLETIDDIEEIEKIVIQDTKLKRCCTASLELLKAVLEYLKI